MIQAKKRKIPSKAPGIKNAWHAGSRLLNRYDRSNLCVIFLTLLIVGIYTISRFLLPKENHAQLMFVEHSTSTSPTEPNESAVPSTDIFSGTKYETALRLREASSVGVAVTLAVFTKYSATRQPPLSVEEVISEVLNRKLLPPGITVEKGAVRSEFSTLSLNYRSSPLAFEVISLPIDGKNGPALLFQFPLPRNRANSVMYFQSTGGHSIPVPFTSVQKLATSGWRISYWDPGELAIDDASINEMREQNVWLKSTSNITR